MTTKLSFISVDEHVQEHPEVWTKRLSRQKWGERIPHVAKNADGNERWLIDGRGIALDGVADCGAVMAERNKRRALECAGGGIDPGTIKSMDGGTTACHPTVQSRRQNFRPLTAQVGA
jgi:hypothetical protein